MSAVAAPIGAPSPSADADAVNETPAATPTQRADPQNAIKARTAGLRSAPAAAPAAPVVSDPTSAEITVPSGPKDVRMPPGTKLTGGLFGIDAVPARVSKSDVVRESEYQAPPRGGEFVRHVAADPVGRTYTDSTATPLFTIETDWRAAKATVSWMREQRIAIVLTAVFLLVVTWRWFDSAERPVAAAARETPANQTQGHRRRHRHRRRSSRHHSGALSGSSPSSRTAGAPDVPPVVGRSSGRHR